MPATKSRRASNRQVLTSGPWKGVRDTVEPYDDAEDHLNDATNIYIPDPEGGSAAFARSGFMLANLGAPVYTGKGQCVYSHIAVDGTVYSFIVGGGKLYRANAGVTAFTDVTPTGVTIDTISRVKMVSLGDSLIVSDRVNRPWIASNLGATPITGTYINYDSGAGSGVAWSAQDITVYGGAIVVILHQVAGVDRQSDISWSEPGTPDTGWQQTDFDNNWTLEQTGSSPLYAIVGTNVALYYFRQRSIGAISGAIGPDLQTTSTHDAISFNVGTRSPETIQTYGNFIYFADGMGRAWRVALGETPEPIWLNMRAVVDRSPTTFPEVIQETATSGFLAQLNGYVVAPFSQQPAAHAPPTEMYHFDARSGRYLGRWNIKGPNGVAIECMGLLSDALGSAKLVVLGSRNPAPSAGGYVWRLNPITTFGASHITEEGVSPPGSIITTEAGLELTTEAQPVNWTDDGFLPDISITTSRMGYQSDVNWNLDRVTVIAGSPDSCQIEVLSSATPALVTVGSPVPGLSADATYRLVAGLSLAGRGARVKVRPLAATTQWSCDRVSVVAVPSQARPEDA